MYGGNPREALDLLGKAGQLIGQTASVVSAMVRASQARAHASLGDERESQAAIQQAVTALDHSTARDQHLFAFSAPQLAFYETTSHLRLGRSTEAQESGHRALALYEATPHYMDPALVRFDIATSFVQQKEIEEACRIGHQALDIRAEHQTGPIIQRARELRRALKPYSDQASVRDFDELLACV